MRRNSRLLALAAMGLALALAIPQGAAALEGMGGHKGSWLFFPYYDNSGANITFYRISMDTEVNDVQVSGQLQLHMHYMTPNPSATGINSVVPPCLEFNRYLDFTLDDYILLNVDQHNQQFDTGWAFAYAVIRRPDASIWKVVWDRYFSDTVYVDTALGTAAGWPNQAQFGDVDQVNQIIVDLNNDGVCDYSVDIHNDDPLAAADFNDVCLLETDDDTADLGDGDPYWAAIFPDVFYLHYFTEFKFPIAGGPPMDPTEYVIVAIEESGADEHDFPPGPEADDGDFAWDAEVFNANERPFSTTEQFIICQDVLDIHQLTNNVTLNNRIPEGFVNIWGVDTFDGGDNEDAAIVQIERWSGLNNIMWGFWPAHERTTMDVETQSVLGDFTDLPNDTTDGDDRRSDDDDD